MSIKFPITRLPGGMLSARPRLNIDPGKMAWVENYLLSRGAYHSREGFEKLNTDAIPKSGLRFDGEEDYLEISAAATLGTDFDVVNDTNLVVDVSFILEDYDETDGKLWWIYTVSKAAATDIGIGLVRTSGLVQVRVLMSGTTYTTSLDLADSIKPGVGYRIVALKDRSISTTAWRVFVYRQGNTTPLTAGSNDTDLAAISGESYIIGRSFETECENYFKGIIQEFRFYRYANGVDAADVMNTEHLQTNAYDQARARFEHELAPYEASSTYLKCYLKMDEIVDDRVVDQTGNGYHGYVRPGRPAWVAAGLVDNAPVTRCIKLDDRQLHYLRAPDRPSALGASVFNAVRLNTRYEFTVSMAIELDETRIAELEAASDAPDILPLFYFGDEGAGGLGRDVSAAGEWAIAIELENVGTTAASQYRIRYFLVDEDDTRYTGFAGTHDIVPGSRYRIDLVRSEGRYLYARQYKDGEKFSAQDGEELQADLGAGLAAKKLYDGAFSNGGVMLFGTLLDSQEQRYFPGKIDDIRVYSANAEAGGAEYGITQHPWDKIEGYNSYLVLHLPLNEGQGAYVRDVSSYNNNLASAGGVYGEHHSLEPASNSPPTLGAGWVKANRYNHIRGLFGFKDIETQQEVLLAVAGHAIWGCPANFGADETRFTPLWHNLEGDRPMRMVHCNGQAIFSDGRNDMLRYDGKSIGPVGIPAPASAPVLTDAGAVGSGLLAGTYLYFYTYHNSKTGGHSNPSPTATVTVAADHQVNVAPFTPPTGVDYLAVDEIWIWRTQAGGSTYYWVGTMKVPNRDGIQAGAAAGPSGVVMAVHNDTTRDANIGITTFRGGATSQWFSRLPKCKHLASGHGRIVGVGTPGNPNRIVWCELNYPDHHHPLFQMSDEMDAGDGDEATGAIYVNGKVFLFQRRAIWVLRGVEDEETMRLDQLYAGIGCVDQSTIRVKGGTIFFRGEDNFYALDSASANPIAIGNDIRNLLELADPADDETGTSAVLAKEGIYLCAVTSVAGKAVDANCRNDYVFAFHMDTGQWALWTIPHLGALQALELGGRSDLYALTRPGFVYRYSGRGQDVASGVSLLLSYADGLGRGNRSAFTLKSEARNGSPYVEVLETDSVYTAGDGMKGCSIRWMKGTGELSKEYTVRIQSAITGGYRLYLTNAIAEDEPAAFDDAAGWWRFNENTGTNVADEIGANDITLHSDDATQWVAPIAEGDACVDFIFAESDYGEIVEDAALNFAGTFSASLWLKTSHADFTDRQHEIFSRKGGNLQLGFEKDAVDDIIWLRLQVKDDTGLIEEAELRDDTPSVWIRDGQVHHIVATFAPLSRLRLYVDGKLADSDTTKLTGIRLSGVSNNWGVMARLGEISDDRHLGGVLDDLAFWGQELTAEEVLALWGNFGPVGYECYVGGYTRRLITADLDMGDYTSEKTLAALSIAAAGPSVPSRPKCAPTVPDDEAGAFYGYAYTWATATQESRLSPEVRTNTSSASVTCESPGPDLGDDPVIRLYRRTVPEGNWELRVEIEITDTDAMGAAITYIDDGTATSGDYDPENGAAELMLTVQGRDRRNARKTTSRYNKFRMAIGPTDLYLEPTRMRANVMNLDLESWIPGAAHVLEAITALYQWSEQK